MPFFITSASGSSMQEPLRESLTGVGATPYETVDEARAAMLRSEEQARAHGIVQSQRIVEAPTHQDALLFASGAQPPHVLERMFGDAQHVPVGRWVDESYG